MSGNGHTAMEPALQLSISCGLWLIKSSFKHVRSKHVLRTAMTPRSVTQLVGREVGAGKANRV